MTGYSGPSVGTHGEASREAATRQGSRSSAWSNLRFERGVVASFSADGNFGTVKTDDGGLYSNIRIQTPNEMILFLYGELDKIKNIPCLLMYRSIPQDGFVVLGDLATTKEKETARIVKKPFYM